MVNRYVSQLDQSTQQKIEGQLRKPLTAEGISSSEIEDGVRNGMDSKLRDLSGTINIKPYLNVK